MNAFIFDLDGTIADSVASLAYTSNRALARAGYTTPIPEEHFKLYAGEGAPEMLRRCLAELKVYDEHRWEQVVDFYFQEFEEGCLYRVTPYEGLVEALHQLKAQGMKLGVCTNKQHEYAVQVVEHLYGKDYFDFILGQKPTHKRKPSPEGALLVAEQLGVEPQTCVYVGDTATDMLTGKAAGMLTVGVLWGFREQPELQQNGADAVISKPMELVEFIK